MNVSVEGCAFINNSANNWGGAMYGYDCSVVGCVFENNSARYGGAIMFSDTGTVTNCNFTNNKATYDGGAIYFLNTGNVTNCNFINNTATNGGGGAINMGSGTVTNCNFVNNTASSQGGAIRFSNSGTVTNCNFTNNSARYGGAIDFEGTGTVINCNFTNNTASRDGGAIDFEGTGTVTNCNFTGNNATTGSAIYFLRTSAAKTVSNSIFLNNRANAEALEVTKNDDNIIITFKGNDNLLNAIYSKNDAEVTFTNVTYWSANGIAKTGSSSIKPSRSNREAGQNITVSVVIHGKIVLSDVKVTNANGMIVFDIIAGENYFIGVRHDTDSYYTEKVNTISNNTKFNVNVTSQTTNNKTVNLTAKSNIPNEVIKGKLLFIVPNANPITANYAGNGTWWAIHTFEDCRVFEVRATYIGLDNVTINNATITVNKLKTELTAKAVTATYNSNKELVVTLKDINGKALSGLKVTVKITGEKTYTTDAKGQVKINVGKLTPKTYNVKITFKENADLKASQISVKVTVKKAKSKITAKKKTIKKAKKYTITLKSGKKPIKKVKVILKIKKKTFKAKTNKKGKATFKIKKLKKGTYTAKVTFKGNKYYKKSSKKVKITVK